ncbi:hypothetical protein KQX54_016041 [Cotesia glomerata]|uniref:Uncharacterized protein n=1 Tax=Cotesia glomerata TaxID=32391 RepID=A0AAV7IQF6_COTGL|nr:hypothetical protein KQX54_016041 [Cotesia glomerata]
MYWYSKIIREIPFTRLMSAQLSPEAEKTLPHLCQPDLVSVSGNGKTYGLLKDVNGEIKTANSWFFVMNNNAFVFTFKASLDISMTWSLPRPILASAVRKGAVISEDSCSRGFVERRPPPRNPVGRIGNNNSYVVGSLGDVKNSTCQQPGTRYWVLPPTALARSARKSARAGSMNVDTVLSVLKPDRNSPVTRIQVVYSAKVRLTNSTRYFKYLDLEGSDDTKGLC